MQEINLKSLCLLLLSKLKWIVVSVAVGVLLFGSYAYLFVPDQYASSVMVYIRNMYAGSEVNSATAGNLSASEYLVGTVQVMIKTDLVINKTVEQLDGQMTAGELKGAISTSIVQDTPMLKITVQHGNAELAREACAAIASTSAEAFTELEASSAYVVGAPTNPVRTSPNIMKNALIGGLLGGVLVVVIVLVRHFMDDTIHNKRDLQMHLDVPVLGEIPSFDLAVSRKKRGRSHV